MKKHEFKAWELTDKAFRYYSEESGITYMADDEDVYYTYGGGGLYERIGNIDEVNAYFESLQDEAERIWYAYQNDSEDNDWGTGTFDKAEAIEWLRAAKAEHEDAHLALIQSDFCIDEIWEV